MSTGLAVFDTTVQESNTWLKLIEARLRPCDRQQAYGALRAVLQTLRDRLPVEAVLGLSAQLPILLRGVFLEGWRPDGTPSDVRDVQDFAHAVMERLAPGFPRQGNEAAEAVFTAMGAMMDPGEVSKVVRYLPAGLRSLFPFEYRTA